MRMLFTGFLLLCVLSACSSFTASTPTPTTTPAFLATATPELSSSTAPHPEPPSGFEYSSVAETLANLKARKDVSIAVLQGWIIVQAADGLTNWSFPPRDHPAYPAVAKRVLYRDQEGWHLKMDVLCEAERAACNEFIRYFEALNEPIYQFTEQQPVP